MRNLVFKHELWIHGPALGEAGGIRKGWVREPWWSHQGIPLLEAGRAGAAVLGQTIEKISPTVPVLSSRPSASGWPPVSDTGHTVGGEDRERFLHPASQQLPVNR